MDIGVINNIDISGIDDYSDEELFRLYGGDHQTRTQNTGYQTETITQNNDINEGYIPEVQELNKPNQRKEFFGTPRKLSDNASLMIYEIMRRKYRLIFLNDIAQKKLNTFYSKGYFDKNLYEIIDDRLFKTMYDNIIKLYMIDIPNGIDVPVEKIYDIFAEDYHEIMNYRTRQGYADIATIYGPDFARIISNVSPTYLQTFIVFYIKKFAMQYFQKNKKHIKWNDLYPAFDESNMDPDILTESWIVKRYAAEIKEIRKQKGGQRYTFSNIINTLVKIFAISLIIIVLIVLLIYIVKNIINSSSDSLHHL